MIIINGFREKYSLENIWRGGEQQKNIRRDEWSIFMALVYMPLYSHICDAARIWWKEGERRKKNWNKMKRMMTTKGLEASLRNKKKERWHECLAWFERRDRCSCHLSSLLWQSWWHSLNPSLPLLTINDQMSGEEHAFITWIFQLN